MLALPSNPLVSVIMPAYNAAAFIRQAVESALAQTYRPLEVLCVDDESTDATSEILERYGARIKVLRLSHVGLRAARNAGINASRGEWIAFLDADDLWDPKKLERQFADLKAEDAVLHSNARKVDGEGKVTSPRWRVNLAGSSPRLLDLIENNQVMVLTAVVKREAIVSVGLFDTNTLDYAEDYQLWMRLAVRGYAFRYVDQVLASYRVHGSNMSENRRRLALGEIYAIRSTRREYPSAFGPAERRAYHRRLNQIEFDLAWHLYNQGEYVQAWRHFWPAVWHRPTDWKAWAHAAVTSLPLRSRLVPLLRR
jgi:glycosyltransferase involved in cell wall biosynthesis